MANKINWPGGKDFAFTIFDDTDLATIENIRPVYEFCANLDFRFTKSVWPLKGKRTPKVGGATCEDPEYYNWTRALAESGFEIGLHCATYHTSTRAETKLGIERFRELYGHDPHCMANHTGCDEAIYWGSARLSGLNRLAYNVLTRYRRAGKFLGHVEGQDLFWGDICRRRIKYVRNFVYSDINTLKCCPMMPYHDPERPYVNYWFASSEGPEVNAFTRCISEAAQDRLEREGGACIMYTHLACGFYDGGRIDPRFDALMRRLAGKNGWFVPVTTLLDHLREIHGHHALLPRERRLLERRWLKDKLRTGSS